MYTIEKEMFEGKEIRVAVDGDEKYYLIIDFMKDLGYTCGAADARRICDDQDVKMLYYDELKKTDDKMPKRALGVTLQGFEKLKEHRTKFQSVEIECSASEHYEAPEEVGLTIFNKEIIPAYRTDTGLDVVIGRELHQKLQIKSKYRDWFVNMCAYGFKEGVDFFPLLKNKKSHYSLDKADLSICENNPILDNCNQDKRIDHVMTLDMAKQIAMVQRTPQGMKIRQKLIDLENMVSQNNQAVFVPASIDSGLLKEVREIAAKHEKMILDLSRQINELRGDFLRSATPALEASNLQEQNPYINIINKGPISENVTNIAKVYGYKAQDLNKILKDLGIQEKEGSGWKLCPEYEGYGYTAPGATYTNSDGSTTTQMKWTRKGRYFIHELLTTNGLV